MATSFTKWNSTELESYLIEITSKILTRTDDLVWIEYWMKQDRRYGSLDGTKSGRTKYCGTGHCGRIRWTVHILTQGRTYSGIQNTAWSNIRYVMHVVKTWSQVESQQSDDHGAQLWCTTFLSITFSLLGLMIPSHRGR
jgi:hypothetical protein